MNRTQRQHAILKGTHVEVRPPGGALRKHRMQRTLRLTPSGTAYCGSIFYFTYFDFQISVHRDLLDAKYLIPAGTLCKVRCRDDDKWIDFRTRRDLAFAERCIVDFGECQFADRAWLLRVAERYVSKR